jgi:hypothetical protein
MLGGMNAPPSRFSLGWDFLAGIIPAQVIRAADGPALQRIPRFIVGAARETAAQTHLANPNKSAKPFLLAPFGLIAAAHRD